MFGVRTMAGCKTLCNNALWSSRKITNTFGWPAGARGLALPSGAPFATVPSILAAASVDGIVCMNSRRSIVGFIKSQFAASLPPNSPAAPRVSSPRLPLAFSHLLRRYQLLAQLTSIHHHSPPRPPRFPSIHAELGPGCKGRLHWADSVPAPP